MTEAPSENGSSGPAAGGWPEGLPEGSWVGLRSILDAEYTVRRPLGLEGERGPDRSSVSERGRRRAEDGGGQLDGSSLSLLKRRDRPS